MAEPGAPLGIQELLEANRRVAGEVASAAADGRPRRALAILTCMDGRLDPVRALGLHWGDAHVLRNAGGRVTEDVIRSLLVSSWKLGTRAIVVIHHTGCGMEGLRDADLRGTIREATGVDVGDLPFLGSDDLDRGVEEDVARLRAVEGLPPGIRVEGLVYEVATGLLREVVPPA